MVEIGCELGPAVLQRCQGLYREELAAHALRQPPNATDLACGPHPRHRLDLYFPPDGTRASGMPVMVLVHGGAFVSGDKQSDNEPCNAHVGHWAARLGFLGAVINYRLVLDATWPSGDEDVSRHPAQASRSAVASGHHHYTMAMHLGSSDTRLADEILGFARECCA